MRKWQYAFKHFQRFRISALVIVSLGFCAAPAWILAQTDEIQVYDAVIAQPGIFNVMVHSNFTPQGRTTPVFPGAIVANHSFNGAWEWAYGVKPWMEQGLYMPVYSPYSTNREGSIDGFNYPYWESRPYTAEIRPIMGAYVGKWELIYNPIVDTEWTDGLAGLEFNPAGRVAYRLNHTWDVAAEEYDGFGAFSSFASLHNQFHEAWGVFDRNGKVWDIEAGAGFGLTAGSDRWTLKLMISRDINAKPWRPHWR
jgi:hypothetical protein